jgi:hypothetical protein
MIMTVTANVYALDFKGAAQAAHVGGLTAKEVRLGVLNALDQMLTQSGGDAPGVKIVAEYKLTDAETRPIAIKAVTVNTRFGYDETVSAIVKDFKLTKEEVHSAMINAFEYRVEEGDDSYVRTWAHAPTAMEIAKKGELTKEEMIAAATRAYEERSAHPDWDGYEKDAARIKKDWLS